jgi:cyanate permease
VVFWTLPPQLLHGESAAGGIALISATGGLGSAVAAPIVGSLHDAYGNWTLALLFIAAWALLTPLLLMALKRRIDDRTGLTGAVTDASRQASHP